MTGAAAASPRLLVVVPCRDEAAVLGRKLANLALVDWPAGSHRVVVVDDGSNDGTAERARARLAALPAGVRGEVLANAQRPGKPGAVRTALAALEREADLVVLTDADVVLARGALVALARAFEDPGLAMASGAQCFVAELADDGAPPAERPPGPAATRYDRVTARVRALESRSGRLFSVHGQLLAWRADLGLRPPFGVAADDLALALEVRTRRRPPRAVRRVADAVFFEVQAPPGPDAERRALRRARAYLQVVRTSRTPSGDALGAAQWLAYRTLPGNAYWLLPVGVLATMTVAMIAGGPKVASSVGGALATTVTLALGRRPRRLLRTIRHAARAERRGTLPERWETERR